MLYTTSSVRRTSRAARSFNPDQFRRDSFARQAVIAEFGRHGRALDWGDFVDRLPNQAPRRIDDQIAQEVT